MKSIKPGRGPSFMGGVMSILMGLFGLLWTFIVASHGGGMFALFGVIFIVIAISQAVLHFSNATGKNRFSSYDIVDHTEEADPLNERFGDVTNTKTASDSSRFCPYCGTINPQGVRMCACCGTFLPEDQEADFHAASGGSLSDFLLEDFDDNKKW